MQWSAEEIQILNELLEKDYSRDKIALELGRTYDSVVQKMKRLGLLKKRSGLSGYKKKGYRTKTTEQYKLELPNDIWILEDYINASTKIVHIHSCGHEWLVTPHNILMGSGCPKCAKRGKKALTQKEYAELLKPKNIEVLGLYVNAKTKLLHKHICGHEWSTVPNSILHQDTSCPSCASHGFNSGKEAYTYVLYFKNLDLYKIGVTNNLEKRLKQFGVHPEVIYFRYFESGIDAILLEKEWLHNVRNLRYNSSKLRTGNTETFKI